MNVQCPGTKGIPDKDTQITCWGFQWSEMFREDTESLGSSADKTGQLTWQVLMIGVFISFCRNNKLLQN